MEEEESQPYIAEYCISNKVKCSFCRNPLITNELYFCILNPINGFDGLYPTPYCVSHFLQVDKPQSVKNILHFDKLRPDDKRTLEDKIDDNNKESKKLPTPTLPTSVQRVGKCKLIMKNGCIVDPDAIIRLEKPTKVQERYIRLSEVGHVYKENDQFYSETMCKVDVEAGRNSYFKIQLIEKDNAKTYWIFRAFGRVGYTNGIKFCDEMDSLDSAKMFFNRLFQDKSQVYDPVELEYGNDEARLVEANRFRPVIKLEPQVQTFVETILEVDPIQFEVVIDWMKMPLFQMSNNQLWKGYLVLDKVTKLLDSGVDPKKRQIHNQIVEFTNEFYTNVPTVFDMYTCPMLDNLKFVQEKVEEVENLMDIELDYKFVETAKNLDTQYKSLKCDIVCMDRNSEVWKILEKYLLNTHGATHNMFKIKLLNIYSISRHGESELYEQFKHLHNRRLLWHGSRIKNVGSILENGLKIAPAGATVTGHAFGKGIYFADMASKSANYCFPDKNNDRGALFLCEVALGDIHEISQGGSGCNYTAPAGKHSVKGLGRTVPNENLVYVTPGGARIVYGTPVQSKLQGAYLQYNEYIVYKREQVKVEFLLEVEFNFCDTGDY